MRKSKKAKTTLTLLAGAALLTAPVAAACSEEPTAEQWAETDGAAGRINLDEVQQAFKSADGPTEFEKLVNEIYEGDNIILIRVEQNESATTLEGWEDLNKSKAIEEDADDRLFAIIEDKNAPESERYAARGYGANGYYHSHFGAGDFLFTYMVFSALSGPRYVYATPPARYDTISRDRANYRNSSSYKNQVSRNTSYFDKQKTFAGSKYDQASKSVSPSRQSYLNSQKSSGSYKSSSTGVRSSWGSSSRGSSLGRSSSGFSGGGGAMRSVAWLLRERRGG